MFLSSFDFIEAVTAQWPCQSLFFLFCPSQRTGEDSVAYKGRAGVSDDRKNYGVLFHKCQPKYCRRFALLQAGAFYVRALSGLDFVPKWKIRVFIAWSP
jgi:hypothetical protein